MESIGSRVRHLRQKAGLSMDELAKNILMPSKDSDLLKPTTSATISNIENGRNNPSADIIIALSDFFNVSTDWILKGKEFVKSSGLDSLDIPMAKFEELQITSVGREQILHIAGKINERSRDVIELYNKLQVVSEEVSLYKDLIDQISKQNQEEPPKE